MTLKQFWWLMQMTPPFFVPPPPIFPKNFQFISHPTGIFCWIGSCSHIHAIRIGEKLGLAILCTHTQSRVGGGVEDGISITKIKQLRASSFRNATLLYVTQQRIALMRYGLMNKTSMKGSENPAPLSNWTGEFLSLEFDAIFSFSFLTSLNPIRISFKSLTSFKFRPIDLYESWLNNWMNHRVYKNGVHHIDDVWNDFPLYVWSSCAVCGVGVGTQVAHFRWHAK